MLHCAIIGGGFIGAVHAAAVSKIETCKLVAICDINEDAGRKVAGEYGCKFYADAGEMLGKETIDIVQVCLPTFLHEKYVLLAAQHQKHVLCEKPFALSVEAAQRMADACEKANVKLMVAQAVRWWPEFMEIKKLYDQGAFGEMHMVHSSRLAQHPNWSTWHRDPQKSGGSLFDLNMHNLDYLHFLLGPVASVYAVGWKSPSGCWNHVCASLTFKNGVNVQAEGCSEMIGNYPFSASFRATGDEGTLDYRLQAGFNIENLGAATNKLMLFEKDKEPVEVTWEAGDGFQLELEAFANSVETGKPVPILPEDSVYIIKIIEAIQRSLETGKTEHIQ